MKNLPIFIASSVREFKQARLELSSFLEMLNGVYCRMDVQLIWNRPETSSRMMKMGGSQLIYDDYIRKSEIFALIVGRSVGPYTRNEYEIALEQFSTTGKPKILPCFLADTSPEAQAFRMELCDAPIGTQYIDLYDNFSEVKNQLQWELANYIVNIDPESDAEIDMKRAQVRIADKVHSLQEDIKRLEAEPASQETIAKITLAYAKITRLVQEYKVEPDALLVYMEFLWKQHMYDEAIDLGHWLEGFYRMEPPGDYKLSVLQNRLGLCYKAVKEYKQAKRCYQEELKIEQQLAKANPVHLPYVALTYNNLAALLYSTNQMEESETHYRKALEILRWLAKKDFAYLSDVALTCNNLAVLLDNTNRKEEAEANYQEALEIYYRLVEKDSSYLSNIATTRNNLAVLMEDTNCKEEAEAYYREALEIRRQLADANPDAYLPDVATTCNNLGNLLNYTKRIEKAEMYYHEALEIRRRLAQANPGTYLSCLAITCNNLGGLYATLNQMEKAEEYFREALKIYQRLADINPDACLPHVAEVFYNLGQFNVSQDNLDAAKYYFEVALSLYEQFPHRAQEAQECRDALELLAKL